MQSLSFPRRTVPRTTRFSSRAVCSASSRPKSSRSGRRTYSPQAERYSRGVTDSPFDIRGYRVPFLYSTNGEVFWHHDIRHALNLSRRIADFHTPSALEELLAFQFDVADGNLLQLPNDHAYLRPYQREANAAVEQAIRERKRQMLVAMATGTGKTFTTVNQVYRLMKSGLAKRVLFLVDRRARALRIEIIFSFDTLKNAKRGGVCRRLFLAIGVCQGSEF